LSGYKACWKTLEYVTDGTDMANSPSYLVCLFVVTSGQNGESLGSDEEPIVVLAYALYDIANNKVCTAHTTSLRFVVDL